MPIDYYGQVWYNGRFISWDSATIHVASHVVSYATCLFEGIRCYETPQGPAILRLQDHVARLVNSCKIYRMELPYSPEDLEQAMAELIRVNGAQHAYLRPVIFRGYGEVGVNPMNNPIEAYVLAWKWGKYLGHEALESGIDVCISSWNRMAPNTLPAMAKAAANYMNSQLIKMEAVVNGYTEGIALDHSGNVSEGSGENIFLVRNKRIYTPPLASSVLPGITRDSVITLAQDLGWSVIEETVPREALYIADEVFFCGTAAEITPLRSIDRIVIGQGRPGPVTRKLQECLLAVAGGRAEDRHSWLTYCTQPVAAG
ncbi:MAG: branched-chain amino acid transaminase [Terriglobia bacterium]